jgi:hypothetical protein
MPAIDKATQREGPACIQNHQPYTAVTITHCHSPQKGMRGKIYMGAGATGYRGGPGEIGWLILGIREGAALCTPLTP